jgi:hypothetical protein
MTFRLLWLSMSKHVNIWTDPLAKGFDDTRRISHELAIPFILPHHILP